MGGRGIFSGRTFLLEGSAIGLVGDPVNSSVSSRYTENMKDFQ